MTPEDNPSAVRVSNWTLATGTRPGARDVYPARPTPERNQSDTAARS
ncbi:MAG TPA: hypothetical protein VKE51_12635 [Vicinamibacterales bacterium]|nr:hypothetical protein [Vicinamibacterales bacterium]